MRQSRKCNWELEPFVFYTFVKMRLVVGVREVFNQAPVAGIAVHVTVDEPAAVRRPPVVKQVGWRLVGFMVHSPLFRRLC